MNMFFTMHDYLLWGSLGFNLFMSKTRDKSFHKRNGNLPVSSPVLGHLQLFSRGEKQDGLVPTLLSQLLGLLAAEQSSLL